MKYRSYNKVLGLRAEQRTRKYLAERGIISSVDYPHANPDCVWHPTFGKPKAIEIKSILHITKGRTGHTAVSRKQWQDTKEYAALRRYEPAVIVEIYNRRGMRTYWLLNEAIVDGQGRRVKSKKMISFTVTQIITWAERID